MPFSLDRIISTDDVQIDLQTLLTLLEEKGELWLFDKNKPQCVIVKPNEAALASLNPFEAIDPDNDDSNEEGIVMIRGKRPDGSKVKIGKYVQEAFRKLLHAKALPLEELDNLTSPEYSKKTFNLNFSVLKEYDPNQTLDIQKRDDRGYGRYYGYLLSAYDRQFLLSSQWVEKLHRAKFERWFVRWAWENNRKEALRDKA
jgi:hypothetical protein